VASALETCRPLAAARGQELAVQLPPQPLWLDADPVRLAQVLTNLLHNASKYTPEGGWIELTAAAEDGTVAVRVRDNGAGMTPEVLASAFDLFVQGPRPIDRAQGGLGLGLTLVRRLVELHGGSVGAASEGPGRGSTVVVRLPAAAPAADAPELAAEAAPPAGVRPRRVLVVDDNQDASDSLALLLRIDGHEVETAADGLAALAAAERFRPDVILLDLGLPGIDGYEVARRLRERPDFDGTRIVAVSGYGQPEDRERSRAAGIEEHLLKPVEPRRIRELVRA
jgi:two-component system CheB/CheR fusion protein